MQREGIETDRQAQKGEKVNASLATVARNREGLTFKEWCIRHGIQLNRNYQWTQFSYLIQWSQAAPHGRQSPGKTDGKT